MNWQMFWGRTSVSSQDIKWELMLILAKSRKDGTRDVGFNQEVRTRDVASLSKSIWHLWLDSQWLFRGRRKNTEISSKLMFWFSLLLTNQNPWAHRFCISAIKTIKDSYMNTHRIPIWNTCERVWWERKLSTNIPIYYTNRRGNHFIPAVPGCKQEVVSKYPLVNNWNVSENDHYCDYICGKALGFHFNYFPFVVQRKQNNN